MASPRLLVAASALILGVACISSSVAQPYNANGYFPGYYSASTAAEGFQNGRSNVIRSQGQFLLDSSQAASQFEDARAKNIENRYKSTQAYFDLRRMNKEYRAAEAGPRPSHDDLVRWAQAGKPKALTSSEVNPNNGELTWPKALTINAFEENRYVVQNLMADRAKYGTLSLDQTMTLQRNVDAMKAGLKDHIKDFDPSTYLAGKNFLESLGYAGNQ